MHPSQAKLYVRQKFLSIVLRSKQIWVTQHRKKRFKTPKRLRETVLCRVARGGLSFC